MSNKKRKKLKKPATKHPCCGCWWVKEGREPNAVCQCHRLADYYEWIRKNNGHDKTVVEIRGPKSA